MLDKTALCLTIIGGINWGCVGLFNFDIVAWIFGSQTAVGSRIVYIIIAVAALWCIKMLFHDDDDDEARAKE
jgi:uncharacterized membrane protein YuzA (DUF378 family)